jgi:lipoprotein-releasing system permease protein
MSVRLGGIEGLIYPGHLSGDPGDHDKSVNIAKLLRLNGKFLSQNHGIMDVRVLLSLRYLRPGGTLSLASTLNSISVAGVTVGTTLLIVILSVFNGFYEVVRDLLLSEDPDVRIESAEGGAFRAPEGMMSWIRGQEGVAGVHERVEGKALVSSREGGREVVSVAGLGWKEPEQAERLEGMLLSGEADLGVRDRRPGVLLSLNLGNRLGLEPGERAGMITAEGMRRTLTTLSAPRMQSFDVRGYVSVGGLSGEEKALVDIESARRMYGLRDEVHAIEVDLVDPDDAERFALAFDKASGVDFAGGFDALTWYEQNRPLYDVMRLEKWGSYLVLMIIILVAVLNIVGSLTMIVLQKRRDIGALMTMGLTPADIRRVFLMHGAWIGSLGCVLGGGIGWLLSMGQQTFGWIKLSSAFMIDAYPVKVMWSDVALVLAGTFVLCVLASLYPAVRASEVEPADAVRAE